MKKIAIIGTVGIPAKYGGFESLVEYLTREIGGHFEFTVYCSGKMYDVKTVKHNGAKLKYLPLKANGVQSIPYDILSIINSLREADSLLILGVSGCIILPLVKLISSKKIVVNIDGLEWRREKWGKNARQFLKFSEKMAVKYSDIIIADNKVIQDYVIKTYKKNAQLIAYGGDHTQPQKISPENLKEFPFLKDPFAFKVCRIEPENNIEMILKAFSKSGRLNLVIIGNWENSNYSRRLKKVYEKENNIFLLDPIYDQKKLNEVRSNCFLYIHGHSAGGTNPSLVEAMNLKLPILAYGVNYNRETTDNKALYFDDCKTLMDLLSKLDIEQLTKISEDMFSFASKEYTWKKVSEAYARILSA